MRPHLALVLAAGGSTRLGQPKQLLRRNGETLVRRAVRLAAATHPARLLVTIGAFATAVETELQSCECEIVYNEAWRDGLASTLCAASARVADFDGLVLVLGCDQPGLEYAHLALLLEGAKRSPANAAAVSHAGLPGIPAVVPAAWFADGELSGNRGFGARLRELPKEALFVLNDAVLEMDLDTPQDLEVAIERGWIDAIDDADAGHREGPVFEV